MNHSDDRRVGRAAATKSVAAKSFLYLTDDHTRCRQANWPSSMTTVGNPAHHHQISLVIAVRNEEFISDVHNRVLRTDLPVQVSVNHPRTSGLQEANFLPLSDLPFWTAL
ncbi:hypothetical protein AJ87_13645 [Rhizobium yanglingense]|nr:hypothetical protein AJ87_13645 [Rhizobium yanglingense]